ncbi:MAG: hypothetical protein AB198_00750 [Parcubacteria bacterium C7867-003]|nr:MAG: hypothetical protein AB198_00750 [Parcubacteria bacterium C7867-003]
MPNSGTLLTIATIGVVSALLVFITIRMKRSKVLTRVPYRPQATARRTAQPTTPAPAPQPATPAPVPAAPARTTATKSTFRTWFEAIAGILFAGVVVFSVLMASVAVIEYYKNTPTGGVPAKEGFKIPTRKEVQLAVNKKFYDNMPIAEAKQMVDILEIESFGFLMFNPDGTVLRNGTAVCTAQIKEDIWGAKAKELGFDIYTLDGCLEMALWIRKDPKSRGVHEWEPSLVKLQKRSGLVETITAPVGEWGDAVTVGPNDHGITDRLVTIKWQTKDGREGTVEMRPPPAIPPTFEAQTVWYRTDVGDIPATITYTRR